jgi:hypothetical protein
VNPPDMRELLSRAEFKSMMKRVPQLDSNLTRLPGAWGIWVLTYEDKWLRGTFNTYPEAWAKLVSAVRDTSRVKDVSLVSRRKLWTEPTAVDFREPGYLWCPRCRRPTSFNMYTTHHSLSGSWLNGVAPEYRCFYCGIRRDYCNR